MGKSAVIIEKSIQEYKANPLVPLELSAINRKLRDSNSSSDSFKLVYQRDPIFCWYLIEAGWEATQKRANHPIAADHAMSIIGLDIAKKLFAPLHSSKPQILSQEVSVCLTVSLLAAEIARQIGSLIGANNHIYWTTLLYQMPDTLLWHLKPRKMWRIYYRRLTLPKKQQLFEESMLGFNLHDWRAAVGKHFHLSEQNQNYFQLQQPLSNKQILEYTVSGYSNKTPELKNWHNHEGGLMVLCNKLALATLTPWHNKASLRITQLLQQVTRLEPKKLSQAIYKGIRETSETLFYSQLPNPGSALLLQRNKPLFPRWLVHPEINPEKLKRRKNITEAKVIKNLTQQLAPLDLAALKQAYKQLLEKAQDGASSSTFIQTGLQIFIDLLGYSRISFLLVDHQSKFAQTKIALAEAEHKKIRPEFSFKVPNSLSLFTDKQSFLHFDINKHEKIWHQLPTAIKQQRVTQFIFCSLKPGAKVPAIIYLDSALNELFSEDRLKAVKNTLGVINRGLKIINEKKSKKIELTKSRE